MNFDKNLEILIDNYHKTKADQRVDIMVKILSTQYDRMSIYSNIIISIGYAGFLAIWGGIQSDFTKFEKIASIMSITFSLICFIFWEVWKMIKSSQFMRKQSEVLSGVTAENIDEKFSEFQACQELFEIQQLKLWPINLFLTITFAFVGIVFLLIGFIRILLFN